MTTDVQRLASYQIHSSTWAAALSAKPNATTRAGGKRAIRRENAGTRRSVKRAVATVINGSAVAGHDVRNVVSRSALAATWCASMIAAVTIATRINARFTASPLSRGGQARDGV